MSLDAGRVQTDINNNLGHLCEESVRHLVAHPGMTLTQLQANGLTGYVDDVTRDLSIPSATDVAHVWQEIGFSKKSACRFGPFFIAPDNGDRPIAAAPRKVRVVVQLDVPASVRAGLCAVMTRTSGVEELRSGRFLDAKEKTGLVAGVTTERFDLSPSAVVDATYPHNLTVPCAPTGATMAQLRTFYLWVGFSIWAIVPTTFDVLSISGFELR